MKIKVSRYLPAFLKKILLNIVYRVNLYNHYTYDRKKFYTYAYNKSLKPSIKNIESKIIFHSHSIEKGLSNIDFRIGFGKRAITNLIDYMDMATRIADFNHEYLLIGIETLKSYINKHNNTDIETNWIENKLINYTKIVKICRIENEGVHYLKKADILKNSNGDFNKLSNNRFSVRDFSKKTVSVEKYNLAFKLAEKTPSVCNRQPWKVYFIRDKTIIREIFKIQYGFKGFGHNIDSVILITSDVSYMVDYKERNQAYIDGGMYAMSLLYSLTYAGIGSCALNAAFSIKEEKRLKDLLGVTKSEVMIEFIVTGEYLEKIVVPKSKRINFQTYVKTFNDSHG